MATSTKSYLVGMSAGIFAAFAAHLSYAGAICELNKEVPYGSCLKCPEGSAVVARRNGVIERNEAICVSKKCTSTCVPLDTANQPPSIAPAGSPASSDESCHIVEKNRWQSGRRFFLELDNPCQVRKPIRVITCDPADAGGECRPEGLDNIGPNQSEKFNSFIKFPEWTAK